MPSLNLPNHLTQLVAKRAASGNISRSAYIVDYDTAGSNEDLAKDAISVHDDTERVLARGQAKLKRCTTKDELKSESDDYLMDVDYSDDSWVEGEYPRATAHIKAKPITPSKVTSVSSKTTSIFSAANSESSVTPSGSIMGGISTSKRRRQIGVRKTVTLLDATNLMSDTSGGSYVQSDVHSSTSPEHSELDAEPEEETEELELRPTIRAFSRRHSAPRGRNRISQVCTSRFCNASRLIY